MAFTTLNSLSALPPEDPAGMFDAFVDRQRLIGTDVPTIIRKETA